MGQTWAREHGCADFSTICPIHSQGKACMPSHFSRVRLFGTPWTVAHKGFSRQEHWSKLHALLQGVPHPGIKPAWLMSPASAGGFFTSSTTWESPREASRGKHNISTSETHRAARSLFLCSNALSPCFSLKQTLGLWRPEGLYK